MTKSASHKRTTGEAGLQSPARATVTRTNDNTTNDSTTNNNDGTSTTVTPTSSRARRKKQRQAARERARNEDNSDEETVATGSERNAFTVQAYTEDTRCTVKLCFASGNNPDNKAQQLVSELLAQLQKADRAMCILPWYENDEEVPIIYNAQQMKIPDSDIAKYFPRWIGKREQNEPAKNSYISIRFGHLENMEDVKESVHGWLSNGGHAMYIDMLQAERTKEAGFFLNSFFTMDLKTLQATLEAHLQFPVGLRYTGINGSVTSKGTKAVRAIHVMVNAKSFHRSLQILSREFGTSNSGFADGRKMRFFPSLRNAKSERARASVKKAIERQAFFEKEIRRDYTNGILYLDTIPDDSTIQKTMREMIAEIKSIKYPHLNMIQSVDETWSKLKHNGDHTYLVMPHIEEEAFLMMNNLIPYLKWKYKSDDVLLYFTEAEKEGAKHDKWDEATKRVVCLVDENAENFEDDVDDVGYSEAKAFLEERKKVKDAMKLDPKRNEPTQEDIQKKQQETAEELANMQNVERAFYKEADDDSISTIGSLGTARTRGTMNGGPTRVSTESQQQASYATRTSTPTDNCSVMSAITIESWQNTTETVAGLETRFARMEAFLIQKLGGDESGTSRDRNDQTGPEQVSTAGELRTTPGRRS